MGGDGGREGPPGPELWFLAPKTVLKERDRGGDSYLRWAGKVEGLGILEAEVRCKLREGSSVSYGVPIRGETATWEWSAVSGKRVQWREETCFVPRLRRHGQLHLEGYIGSSRCRS